jgi:hypothetical protein
MPSSFEEINTFTPTAHGWSAVEMTNAEASPSLPDYHIALCLESLYAQVNDLHASRKHSRADVPL